MKNNMGKQVIRKMIRSREYYIMTGEANRRDKGVKPMLVLSRKKGQSIMIGK